MIRQRSQAFSAYNLFFRHERARLILLSRSGRSILDHPPANITADELRDFFETNPLQSAGEHGVESFTELNRIVKQNWKALDRRDKEPFFEVAHVLRTDYYCEIVRQRRMAERQSESVASRLSNDTHDP